MRNVILGAVLIAGLLATIAPVRAADVVHPPKPSGDSDESWTYQSPTSANANARAIVQQKAEIRAQQRMDRLAALNWYGMSNSRPMASGTPYCSMYSPTWQVPGGRPFAWYSNGRPTYLFR
jgi:hypothetical protein